jgi:Ca2+-binding RTX toxin-like protein
MAQLYIAANYVGISEGFVPGLFELTNSGHLQLVYEDDFGNFAEIEVQAPVRDFGLLYGNWDFVDRAVHGERPDDEDYVDQLGNGTVEGRYVRVPIEPKEGQTAEQLWDLLKSVFQSMAEATDLDYDTLGVVQNSNSFVNSILYAVGIDLQASLPNLLTPNNIEQFPGAGLNVLLGTVDSETGVAINASGSDGDDFLRGGSNQDALSGGLGADSLVGGIGNDVLYGGTATEAYDGVGDWLTGGDDEDQFHVGQNTVSGVTEALMVWDDIIDDLAFNEASRGTYDVIRDFEQGTDTAYVHTFINENEYLDFSFSEYTLTFEDYYYGDRGVYWAQFGDFDLSAMYDTYYDETVGSDITLLVFFYNFSSLFLQPVFALQTGGPTAEIGGGSIGQNTIQGSIDGDVITGTVNDDVIYGRAGDDVITGNAGNDVIYGGAGADSIEGGDGNDLINIDANDFWYSGGAGVDDLVFTGSASWSYSMSQGAFENVSAGSGADTIWGTDGDNRITGGEGNDTLFGYGGNDVLVGDGGADSLMGGDGDDYIYADADDTWLSGGSGNDTLVYSGADDREISLVQGSFENIRAGQGNNTVWGGDEANTIEGENGDDTLFGFGADDILVGGAGADSIMGGDGNDEIHADAEDVWFSGGDGVDTLIYSGANNLQYALAQGSFENVKAGAGDNTIWGTAAANVIDGEAGADTLFGYEGGDTLIGGAGADELSGGIGDDTFVFRSNFGQDTIVDFQAGASSLDVIEFENALFGSFAEVLAASTQVGSDTLVTYDVDNFITLSNVALTSLHQDDFRFVA